MTKWKFYVFLWILSGILVPFFTINGYSQSIFIPVNGNTWVTNNTDDKVDHTGMHRWQDSKTTLSTYFKVAMPGVISVAIVGKVATGNAKISVRLKKQVYTLDLANQDIDTVFVGDFTIKEVGYQEIIIQGIGKSASDFADIAGFVIRGKVITEETVFVKDDFYWGRRGPSVHLNYPVPEEVANVVYFYNEITVPEGEDVIGSYFMANGFAEGYFGIQVNSATERRILFSVWSPFKTDDPKAIPEEYKIKLLAKGEGVHTGEFGNEGSGGQSYWRYMWQAGTTYRFLLKGKPTGAGATAYTAYFFAPELGEWKLIASFRRPKTDTYLQRLHSFLENFVPETGYLSRQLFYSNQWVYDTNNQWHELTQAKFTADATARKGARVDYIGGAEGLRFFLKNCGFFNTNLEIGSILNRQPVNTPPQINFALLPN